MTVTPIPKGQEVDRGMLLGYPAVFVEAPCVSEMSTVSERAVGFSTAMDGTRVGLIGQKTRRSWNVTLDAVDSVTARSLGMLMRTQRTMPMRWYPNDAHGGNLLSPQAAEWETPPRNGTDGGLVMLPNGSVAVSLTHTGSGPVTVGTSDGSWEYVLVSPGETISVGVWATNGVNLFGNWRDRFGTAVGTFSSGNRTFSGWQWQTFTTTAPETARMMNLSLSGGTSYALPTISRGETALDLPGRGCPKAVAHDLSEDIEALISGNWRGGVSFTVTEVG